MRRIRPFSRPETLMKLDGRSRHARVLKKVRADLIAHIGGNPTVTQLSLIERAAWSTLHMALMDDRMLHDGALDERAARQYLAWSNTHARIMKSLGLDGVQAEPESLTSYLSRRTA